MLERSFSSSYVQDPKATSGKSTPQRLYGEAGRLRLSFADILGEVGR